MSDPISLPIPGVTRDWGQLLNAALLEIVARIQGAEGITDAQLAALAANPSSSFSQIASALFAAATTPRLRNAKHLATFRAASACAFMAQTSIYVEGDSITAGGNANNGVINTDADRALAAARSYSRQLAARINARLGIDPGEGWIGVGGEEGRWVTTGVGTRLGAYGPISQGMRMNALSTAVLTGVDFTTLDLVGWSGGSAGHLAEITVDGANVRPTIVPAATRAGDGWAARGANTTVAKAGERRVNLTAIADGGVVADSPATADAVPVTAGQEIALTVAITGPRATPGSFAVRFLDAAGAQVGAEISTGAVGALTGGAYGQGTLFTVVPAGAVKATFVLRITNALAGETFEFRDFDAVPVKRRTTTLGGGSFYTVRCKQVPAGAHTITLTGARAGSADVSGIVVRKRTDAGIVVHRVARSGSTTADHLGLGLSSDYLRFQQLTATFEMPHEVMPIALRIIALGTNDMSTITVAEYKDNLRALITRATALGECVLLIAAGRYNLESRPTEEAIYAAAREVSDENPAVAYLDIADSWGTRDQTEAAGFLNFAVTGIHPTFAGHGDYGRIVDDALSRQIITLAED